MKLLYTPCTDEQEATKIANALVKEKLAACANLFPIKSVFSWKKEVRSEEEFVLLVKTTDEKEKAAKERIIELHSYKVPCVLSFSVEANTDFASWIATSVQ